MDSEDNDRVEERLERERKKDILDAQVAEIESNQEEKRSGTKKVFILIYGYATFVATVIFLSGITFPLFRLPAEVLLGLIVSLSAVSVGMVGFIAPGIFRLSRLFKNGTEGQRN